MLKNLDREPPSGGKLAADVAVIGGGIAGLMLANKLARLGVRVVVLESGGETLEGETSSLNEVVLTGQSYQGAEKGRFRCLGGTSVRWGGAMLPFLPCDMGPHTANWPVEWPVTLDQVSPEFPEIEKTFRLPGGPYEVEYPGVEGGDFILRGAKWPAFGMRNVAQVLRESVRGPDLEIWVNATVVQFCMDDGGRLASVRATGQSGAALTVEARTFVVAAGAIESTRLLLLMDRQHDNRIFQPDGQWEAYFFDHLSAPAAII